MTQIPAKAHLSALMDVRRIKYLQKYIFFLPSLHIWIDQLKKIAFLQDFIETS
ncbi:hypothetical protein D3C76_483050 [compost metagenome]